MPLGDEKIYTIDGQEITRSTLVQLMIDFFNNKYPDTNITDFNEGSEIRNILEALAIPIYHLEANNQLILTAAFLATSYGQYLDLFGEELNTPREQANMAWGDVTFSIEEPVNYNITIPVGTVLVSETTGVFYETNMTVEIPVGETSIDCPCHSQVPGAGTNADNNTVTLFREPNSFPGVNVTNDEDFTGGTDMESDYDYRSRLLAVKAQDHFGSREYYTRIGNAVRGVHDVTITSSTNGYTGKVLVNPYSKPATTEILGEVTSVYTNEDNLVYNHSFEVAEVEYKDAPLEIEVVVTDEVQDSIFTDLLSLFFNGGEAVINNTPMNYPGLRVNQEMTNYMIMTAIETLPFVVQVTEITSDGDTFHKLTPGADKVLKLDTVTITQEVAE